MVTQMALSSVILSSLSFSHLPWFSGGFLFVMYCVLFIMFLYDRFEYSVRRIIDKFIFDRIDNNRARQKEANELERCREIVATLIGAAFKVSYVDKELVKLDRVKEIKIQGLSNTIVKKIDCIIARVANIFNIKLGDELLLIGIVVDNGYVKIIHVNDKNGDFTIDVT